MIKAEKVHLYKNFGRAKSTKQFKYVYIEDLNLLGTYKGGVLLAHCQVPDKIDNHFPF